jgi:hypothetical protein
MISRQIIEEYVINMANDRDLCYGAELFYSQALFAPPMLARLLIGSQRQS